ncbi:hypothetical protein TNCV_402591 [Trichonephila clavipes]|nr:hypothetical protein TNCV_402591 [Trichonephila clavipes]
MGIFVLKSRKGPSLRGISFALLPCEQRCSADVMLQRHVLQVDMFGAVFSFYLRKTSYYPVALQPPL